MKVHDALGDKQPEPAATASLQDLRVELHNLLEETLLVLRANTSTRVGDLDLEHTGPGGLVFGILVVIVLTGGYVGAAVLIFTLPLAGRLRLSLGEEGDFGVCCVVDRV
jgi:hypothetical protein